MSEEAKDWNNAHLNGHRSALQAADFIWGQVDEVPAKAAKLATDTQNFSNFSGFSGGQDPLPLTRTLPAISSFPVEALGPSMGAAAHGIHARTQAPMDICSNALLAVAGLAAQAHADVVLPTGEIKPLSLFLVTIAASGERKTSTDNLALSPVREQEAKLREEHEVAAAAFEIEIAAWDAERKKILADKKLNRDGRKALLETLGSEPKAPLSPITVCHEPTFEGLVRLLANGQPSVGIFASEGGVFIGGHGFSEEAKLRTAAGLSLLWDDGRLTRVRAGESATALTGRRVALHLQAQPDVASRVFADPVLSDQGLLSRILVVAPESKQGTRLWREPTAEHKRAASAYVDQVNRLFRRPMPIKTGTRNELQPRPLPLSPEARQLWIQFADEIERQLGPRGELSQISGFAAKLPEHAARIAGVLAMFENPETPEIEARLLLNAMTISQHYAQAALRLHGQSRLSEELKDAEVLLDWVHMKADRGLISLPDIVQSGPNKIRETATARRLVRILEQHRQLERLPGTARVNGKDRHEVWRVVGALIHG
jgi:uncharacterized protein DUF3987